MMTTDEAIQRFEKQLTDARVVLDGGFGTQEGECDTVYRHRKEMAEIALAALHRTAEDDKAREDGRLVELPSKTVFIPTWDSGPKCDLACPVSFDGEGQCGLCDKGKIFIYERPCRQEYIDQIGKTVFLTRQEAEAALGGGEGD